MLFLNIFYWATLKKEAAASCEILVNKQQRTRRYMSENFDFRKCDCEKINGRHTPIIVVTYHFIRQSPSWEATRFSASKEISRILWNPKVHYRMHRARHLSLSWARSMGSMPPHSTSWRSILILYSLLHLGLPSGLFPSGFPHQNPVYHDKWVPVTTAWRVLRLRMNKRPPGMEGSCEDTE